MNHGEHGENGIQTHHQLRALVIVDSTLKICQIANTAHRAAAQDGRYY